MTLLERLVCRLLQSRGYTVRATNTVPTPGHEELREVDDMREQLERRISVATRFLDDQLDTIRRDRPEASHDA